jgi:hypothetical protein
LSLHLHGTDGPFIEKSPTDPDRTTPRREECRGVESGQPGTGEGEGEKPDPVLVLLSVNVRPTT